MTKELTKEQIIAAAKLSAEPTEGAVITVTRAGAKREIPIQLILKTLHDAYPTTTFRFTSPEKKTLKPESET